MDRLYALTLIIVSAPLVGAIVAGLFGKLISRSLIHWINCGLVGVSFILSSYLLFGFITNSFSTLDKNVYVWATSGDLSIALGFLVDRLSVLMITVVTFVSLMVHIYTIGYMHDDPGYKRFFCYISLFTFAMLMLVLANNFTQLFFGWEAVGLLSYLLIGFWFKVQSANFASLKAFLINRIGDMGFIIGIAAVLYCFNSLDFQSVFAGVPDVVAADLKFTIFNTYSWSAVTVICISLFIGAMAKSAQIPLHVWLPDSMEGPTPISALIHAATMVTAGVFLVARMSPLFEFSETALTFVVIIGSLTCFFMGILGVIQTDIKRIIAYSTISQLGYMIAACGVSAYAAGIFHLATHAFFKALLFLAAGSIIIALHHEQNIFAMGKLRKLLPITFVTMLIGTLALIGLPGTAGFYSKDLIIASAGLATIPGAKLAYYATLFSVFITALYSMRLILVVFFSHARMSQPELDKVHEPAPVVWVPLVILSIPSLLIGAVLIGPILNDFFQNAIYVAPQHDVLSRFRTEEYPGVLGMLLHGFVSWPFFMLVLGALTAWLCYQRYQSIPTQLSIHANLLARILQLKYGFDWINENLIMPATRSLGLLFWRVGDMLCIDRFMVDGTARTIARCAGVLRKAQSGFLYDYILLLLLGLLGLLVWIFVVAVK